MLLVTGLVFPAQVWADDIRGAVAATTNAKLDESGIVPGKVIVKYKSHASKGEDSVQSRSFAASPFAVLSFDEQISVADKIAELQRDPDVDYAEPVYTVRLIASASNGAVNGAVYSGTEEYRQHWGKLATNLSDMGSNSSRQLNEQITIAVMDTGIDMVHPALKDSIVAGYDFINNDAVAQDDNGHGTHVSGIIAANSVNGSVYGIAPGVKIMPLKVLDKNGAGDTEKLINALKFAITNRADIVNMSLGIGGNSRALHEVIKQAYDQKIVLVAAAGNESNHWLPNEAGQLDIPTAVPGRYVSLTNYPAAYEEVVSVGAIAQLPDLSFAVADFSNVGKVDVVAPGVNIYSTALGGGYVYKSGTSQATPMAAGLAVLLKASNKAFDTEDVRSILGTSAKSVTLKALPSAYGNLTTSPNDHVSYSMAYGDGMIQGNRAFAVPRLKLTKVTADYPANKTVTYEAALLDIHNTVVKATYNVTLEARDYYETNLDRDSDQKYSFGLESRGQLVDGNKRLSANFGDNNASHRIYMYGTWEEPIPAGGFYTHRSNSYTFLNRPALPVVNLQSGTYTGEQTVRITSSYQDAQLYYMLQTADKTSIGKFDSNSGSLKITQDSILTVATLHKKVYSDDAVFLYKINAPTVTPVVVGGGGPGGGSSSGGQSAPYKDADGKTVYDLNPPRVDLIVSLNSSSNELVLDASSKEQLDKFTVKFDADIIPKAWSREKTLVIKSNELTVSVPPNAFQVKNQNNSIQFIAAIDPAPAVPNFTAVSPRYDMTISEKGEPIAAFDKPVQVTFSYDKTKVKNPQNLGVYVLDEQKNVWNSVGGTLSDADTITASLPHFSKYAVLEKMPAPEKQQPTPATRTFADIQNHWAKAEIEKLAAARIVDGVDETSFKPDSNMTRAQFVTLLSRALQLQSSGTASTFSDVSADAWYNKAVYAAREANIVSGVSEKEFAPDAFITREQMAVMMVNAYLFATGKKLSDIAITQEVKYSDEGSISDWARSYVRAASGLGLVNGTDSGNFAPADNSTRAQAAVVLHRMLAKLNK
jgi:subtilisin family serine protease